MKTTHIERKEKRVIPIGGKPVTRARLREIVRRIVERFDPERIILFGSYAYGAPTPHSDVDVFVVMESNQRPLTRIGAVSALFPDRDFPMDFIVRTSREVAELMEAGDPFTHEVIEKGRLLYAKNKRRE